MVEVYNYTGGASCTIQMQITRQEALLLTPQQYGTRVPSRKGAAKSQGFRKGISWTEDSSTLGNSLAGHTTFSRAEVGGVMGGG